ncbi:roadblock/LC7 domain-containing protein [Methanoregula sp.]|uniref:roadblock/LC7 domain-containing protein n=1 Tax=Methanoregula sp. TaxID=2052170 RepID=UPI00356617BB
MNFPAGTDKGIVTDPKEESFIRKLSTFRGACQIETEQGYGFILIDNGRQAAAYFRTGDQVFSGNAALAYIQVPPLEEMHLLELRVREYDDAEFSLALQIARFEHILCTAQGLEGAANEKDLPTRSEKIPALLNENALNKLMSIPGVIAVSAFFDGFPVQSAGDADFELVAVSAEDFMRAGTRIAQEMGVGDPGQLILETATSKFIITPCGDLYLCLFTTSDAQLGLIRVVLASILSERSS